MRLLRQIYKLVFFDTKNTLIVFFLLYLFLSLCSGIYTSNLTFNLLLFSSILVPLYCIPLLKKGLLPIFIVGSAICLFYFDTIWLDYLFTVNLLSLLVCFSLSQDLLGKKIVEDNIRVEQLSQKASLYKNRFDTIVVEHQKKVLQSESEIKDLNDTIQLQKERIEKLDSLIKHQEVKCVEVGLHARTLSQEIQDLKEKNDLFETYCRNMAEKINKKNTQNPVKKVPLVALRKQSKQTNKIVLTDLAKNLKR